jgi:hypothetical protein
MNWDYLAGLFDGEGCVTLIWNHGSMFLSWRISSSDIPFLQEIKTFLENQGFHPYIGGSDKMYHATNTDKWFKVAHYVLLTNWKECEAIADILLPLVFEKKEQLSLLKEAAILGQQISGKENMRAKALLPKFSVIREKLHLLSKKGRRTLKPWVA